MGFDLKRELEREGIFLEESFFRCSEIFAKELLNYSKTHNITALDSIEEIYENIFDSIYPLKFLGSLKSLLDIGTGAGFPGLVLSFALRESEVFLSEPIMKRSAFLYLIKIKCSLDNVKILNKRVEQIEPFFVDLITSRAVTDTKRLLELGRAFCKEDTLFLFYKGEGIESEKEFLKNIDHRIYKRDKRRYLIIKGCYDF
ncbi:MAG: 16S rRNA (guanine(527)-N(7))-methyltransferase RsmG [Epsilonproteobacteria bacterium]|nr:16S rRNA (guanine(527)-N(7))-methyltransferase RsmG [Campylobacterota bacterium]